MPEGCCHVQSDTKLERMLWKLEVTWAEIADSTMSATGALREGWWCEVRSSRQAASP